MNETSSTNPCYFYFNTAYVVSEAVIGALAVIGNFLTILIYFRNAHIRRKTHNVYIISLSITDFLVGAVAVPVAILNHYGLPTGFRLCLFLNSLLMSFCTISIFSLLAVSFDRYLAIRHAVLYQNRMTVTIGIVVSIGFCWFLGFIMGMLPSMGWNRGPPNQPRCVFMEIVDPAYLLFIFFATIVTPAIIMGLFYGRIYCVVRQKLVIPKLDSLNPPMRKLARVSHLSPPYSGNDTTDVTSSSSFSPGNDNEESHHHQHGVHLSPPQWGGILEFSPEETRRSSLPSSLSQLAKSQHRLASVFFIEVRAARSVFILIVCFLICWFPLYTLDAVFFFHSSECPVPTSVIQTAVALSHANSALNPFLYAYAIREFRHGFHQLFTCQRHIFP